MTYGELVWKNAVRNKRRTLLTILSVTVSMFAFSTLLTLLSEVNRRVDDMDPLRLFTRHAVSLTTPLPERHLSQIENVAGVVAVTPLNMFPGIYLDEAHTDFARFSCDPKRLLEVYTRIKLPTEQKQAFIQDRTGIIVGRRKAEKYGWKLGDRLVLKGVVTLELTVAGVFDGTVADESAVYFNREYLEEKMGRPGTVGAYWLRANSIPAIPYIAQTIDKLFQDTDAPTKTETERAFQINFVSMLGNLKMMVTAISSVIIFTILLITGNTMSMSVRERIREISIMQSLGFRRRVILSLLISEGLLITITGGTIGCFGVYIVFSIIDATRLAHNILYRFEVTWEVVVIGLGISCLIGLLSVSLPAYYATNHNPIDGLRHR